MIKKKYVFFFIVLLFTLLTSSILYATDNTTDTTTTQVVNNADNPITEPIQVSKETQQTIDKTTNNTNKEVNSKLDKTAKNIKTEDEIIVNDYDSLKSGIDALEYDDEATFKLNPENTYTITDTISINKPVTITINGNGATLNGDSKQWMNGGNNGLILTIANITVQNCKTSGDGGVFSITSGEIILENSTFIECQADYQGGVINGGSSEVTFTNCTFKDNKANAGNGGVIFTNNDLTVTNSYFTGSWVAFSGGSIRINDGYLYVENSTFENGYINNGENGGAAIYAENAEAMIIDSTFIGNDAYYWGGAIYSKSDLTINKSTFKNNLGFLGGAIYSKGDLTVDLSSFEDNGRYDNGAGAAIYVESDQDSDYLFILNNSNFTNHYSPDDSQGGALYIAYHTALIDNSNFNNTTALSGGAIYSYNNQITINNTNFTNQKGIENTAETEDDLGRNSGTGIFLTYATATIDNSNFENISGDWGGAIYGDNDAEITINNSKFKNISSTVMGGAILSYGPLSVNNSKFMDNYAPSGAAVYAESTTIIDSSTFNNQSAKNGGSIYIQEGQLTVNNSNFTNNNECGAGGAIYSHANTKIDNSKFINNSVQWEGGAINAFGPLTVNNSKFINNYANNDAGAIFAVDETYIDNSEFTNNSANNTGGAIHSEDVTLNVNNSKFTNNSANKTGGAIYTKVDVSINNSEFTNNSANKGGAVYGDTSVKVTVDSSKFTNNSAEDGGAVFSNTDAIVTVDNSTLTNNQADVGGAVYSYNDLTINQTTFTNNNAEFYGGAIYFFNGKLTIDESEFVNNTVIFHGEGSTINKGAIASPVKANVSLTNSNITIDSQYIDKDTVISHNPSDDVNVTRDNNTINGVFVDEGYVLTHFVMDYPEYLIVGEETTITGEVYDYLYKSYRNDTVKVYVDDVEIGEYPVETNGKFNFTITQTQAKNTTIKLELISSDHYYTFISEEKELDYKIQAEIVISTDKEVYESTPITVTGTLTSNNNGISDKQVNIYVNDELMGMSEATDSEGKFTYTFTANNPGIISIYAELDDEHYIANKSNTVNVTNKVATTITLDEITNAKVNEETTITGTLTYGDNVPVENQKVTITIGEESFESDATDSEGKFTYTYTPTAPGKIAVSAKFNANDYYLDSNEASINVTVTSATTLAFDELDEGFIVKVGDGAVELNGTLKDANGNGVADKEIKFTVGEAESTVTTDSEGKFTYVFTPETIGENLITAVFDGDEVYSLSYGNITVTVKADTQITLEAITTPVNVGDKVTVTGKLTDVQGNALAGQNVSIKLGETTETAQTSDDGTFTYDYETTTVGVIPISAVFEDNGFYLGSASSSQDVVVVTSTKIVVDEITSPVTIGTNVEITGKLTDANDNPIAAQDITLYINGEAVNAEITTDDQGIFTYSYLTTANGLYNVTAEYAGQDYYLENKTSNVVEFTVKTPTTITVQPITTPVKVNDEITINVELNDSYNNAGLTGQTIIIKVDGEAILSDITDNDDGTYTAKYTVTTAGEHTVTAAFEETNNYFASEDTTGQNINAIVDTTVVLNAIDTIARTQVTITVTINAADDSTVNEGKVTLTLEDGTVLATANVENSQATITYTFDEELDTTITATFNQSEKYADSNATNTIKVVELPVMITVDTTTFTIGQTTQLKATIYQGSEIVETLNKGKVVFKVNGKSLKDANGKVIYAKVVNGTAIIDDFTVPDSWNKENTTITASYTGCAEISSMTSDKYNITIVQPQPTITTNDITATAGSTISLNATINAGTEPVNTGKVVFKINGKTVKDANGKVIYAKVVNGMAIIDSYTIPSSYKAKEYTITATYISSDIKIEDIKTLNITA